jgi:hypothetical protein
MATTVSMASADVYLEDMTVERSLHCKYVSSPRRLSLELKDLLGAGQYKVEVMEVLTQNLIILLT